MHCSLLLTRILLTEHLCQIEGLFDSLFPEFSLEGEFDCLGTPVDGWKLEEVSSDD